MSADVFVDRTGRRRRVLTWLAVTSAVVLVGALGLLGAGVITGGPLPLRGWTDLGGSSPGPDTAVIGPAPAPAPAPATPRPSGTAQPTNRPAPTGSPVSRATATTGASEPRGKGAGRGNRPTAKPSHPNSKTG